MISFHYLDDRWDNISQEGFHTRSTYYFDEGASWKGSIKSNAIRTFQSDL